MLYFVFSEILHTFVTMQSICKQCQTNNISEVSKLLKQNCKQLFTSLQLSVVQMHIFRLV